mmetsp:Transcript_20105/g.31903  ORF Transcript_20105/g.31903 Transcript_20105/m.31903 type:complete len:88 (+) Transcript_20105:1235-1498(+)
MVGLVFVTEYLVAITTAFYGRGTAPASKTWNVYAGSATIRYKSRLVARGFTQIPGEDFFFSYSPTLSLKGGSRRHLRKSGYTTVAFH